VTASIHQLTPPSPQGLSQASTERLQDAARALSRMGPAMARSIEVVGLDGPAPLVSIAAERIAASFDLVATVKTAPLLSVLFVRR
jgi:hypothetical protein